MPYKSNLGLLGEGTFGNFLCSLDRLIFCVKGIVIPFFDCIENISNKGSLFFCNLINFSIALRCSECGNVTIYTYIHTYIHMFTKGGKPLGWNPNPKRLDTYKGNNNKITLHFNISTYSWWVRWRLVHSRP